jgi:hypothetical protein
MTCCSPQASCRKVGLYNDAKNAEIRTQPLRDKLGSSGGLPLASSGNASRTMRKGGELFVRGVFDLGVRRKPQAFAAEAVSLWILNLSLLIINELELSNVMPRQRTYSPRSASLWNNSGSASLRLRSYRQTVLEPVFSLSRVPSRRQPGVVDNPTRTGRDLLDRSPRRTMRHKNPRPTSAERPGISF